MSFLDLVQQDVSIRKHAAADGGEYVGPCPFCHDGSDRFHIWPNAKRPNYWCRVCGAKGDAIDYLRQLKGMSFQEAKAALGEPVEQPGNLKVLKGGKRERGAIIRRTEWPLYELDGRLVVKHIRHDYVDGSKEYPYEPALKDLDLTPADLPLYGLPALAAAQPGSTVVLVEGEKATDALNQSGVLALGTACSSASIPTDERLKPLLGWDIVLWPDADGERQRHAGQKHMSQIAVRLIALGARPRLITWTDAPESGDAADYIAQGLPLADILASAQPWHGSNEPTITRLDEDAFRLELPTGDGMAVIQAESVSTGKGSLEADLTIAVDSPGVSTEGLLRRLNFLSSSGCDAIARDLCSFHGQARDQQAKERWLQVINRAGGMLRREVRTHDPSLDIFERARRQDEDRYRIDKILLERQPTIIFGDGDTGKSTLGLAFGLSAALGQPHGVGCLQARQGHVLYADWEADYDSTQDRVERLLHGTFGIDQRINGLLRYWNPHGRILADVADALRRRIRDDGTQLLIIDSAAAACGKPEDAEATGLFFRVLASFQVTTLIIAHINKLGEVQKPFGSVFWHNLCRISWYARKVQEMGESESTVALINRKFNYGPRAKPLAFRLRFDGETGPIAIDAANATDIPEFQDEALTTRDKLIQAIQIAPAAKATPAELARLCNLPAAVVRARLNDAFGKRTFQPLESGYYGLREAS